MSGARRRRGVGRTCAAAPSGTRPRGCHPGGAKGIQWAPSAFSCPARQFPSCQGKGRTPGLRSRRPCLCSWDSVSVWSRTACFDLQSGHYCCLLRGCHRSQRSKADRYSLSPSVIVGSSEDACEGVGIGIETSLFPWGSSSSGSCSERRGD